MKDYLKELCSKENIKLVYTHNKRILLSSSLDKDSFIIRSHISFKFCPQNVAEAIVKYYYSSMQEENHFEVIETYVKTILKTDEYIIKPPGKKAGKASKNMRRTPRDKSEKYYEELDILKINKETFWGETYEIPQDKSFEADDEDVVELAIIVSPFDT